MTEQQRADWLAWRRQGLGGSDVAAIVGLSPWQSRWALWAEKTGLVDDDEDSEAMEFGRRAEGMVASYFRDRTGLDVAGEQTWLVHPEHSWMRATADGFVFESGGAGRNEWGLDVSDALGVLEIKCTSLSPQEWEENGVPDHIQCQAQWLMAVAGLGRVWLAVFHMAFGRPKFRTYEVERNEADIDFLMGEGEAFWALVQSGTPPDVDGSEATTRTLQRAWEADRGESVELNTIAFDALLFHREELERVEAEVTRLTNLIKVEMQSATEGTVDGRSVCSWRPSKAMDIPKLLADLQWVEAVKALDGLGFEVADHLKLDLAGWARANRKRAAAYKTAPGSRRFLLTKQKETA